MSDGRTPDTSVTVTEPRSFEDAKGIVQHFTALARETLKAYFEARPPIRGKHISDPKIIPFFDSRLAYMANASHEATSPQDWAQKLRGSPTIGSSPINVTIFTKRFIDAIRILDKDIPPGTPEDIEGALTKVGLEKLSRGLGLACHEIIEKVKNPHPNDPYLAFKRGFEKQRASDMVIVLTGRIHSDLPSKELTQAIQQYYFNGVAINPPGGSPG